jgi:tRNA-dihydrouridine synthase
MGCPDKTIIKQGAGAALITTPQLAQQVFHFTHSLTHTLSFLFCCLSLFYNLLSFSLQQMIVKSQIIEHCKNAVANFPVSVKTRIGYNDSNNLSDWMRAIFDTEPDRTYSSMR